MLAWASLVAQTAKNFPAMSETQVWSLGREDPLEKRMATYSSILYWENSMDRGAWWATVHGIAKNQMHLSDFEQESIWDHNLWGHKIRWLWEADLYKPAFLISVQLMLVKPLSFWVVTTETISRDFHMLSGEQYHPSWQPQLQCAQPPPKIIGVLKMAQVPWSHVSIFNSDSASYSMISKSHFWRVERYVIGILSDFRKWEKCSESKRMKCSREWTSGAQRKKVFCGGVKESWLVGYRSPEWASLQWMPPMNERLMFRKRHPWLCQ